MVVIFTYERLDMLTNLVKEVKASGHKCLVIDDGSSYPWKKMEKLAKQHGFQAFRTKHYGKEGFFRLWDFALHMVQEEASDDKPIIFIPDDFSNIDFAEIDQHHNNLSAFGAYVCNVVNDGRGPQWTTFKEKQHNNGLTQIGWTDCGFFCDRKVFDWIGYTIDPIPASRFTHNTEISSGVGEQLTKRLNRMGIPVYRPVSSLAYHGEHDSVMHPEHRKKQPLISK